MRCYRSKSGPTAYPGFIRQRSAVLSDNRRLKVDGDASANPDSAQRARTLKWRRLALVITHGRRAHYVCPECVELVANRQTANPRMQATERLAVNSDGHTGVPFRAVPKSPQRVQLLSVRVAAGRDHLSPLPRTRR